MATLCLLTMTGDAYTHFYDVDPWKDLERAWAIIYIMDPKPPMTETDALYDLETNIHACLCFIRSCTHSSFWCLLP